MIIQTSKPLAPRREADFYPTDIETVKRALQMYQREITFGYPQDILDPGAGDGVWGDVARDMWRNSWIEGVEIRNENAPDSYNGWRSGCNFLTWEPATKYGLIMGNPPYRDAEEFVRHSISLLDEGGYLVFLLRLAFLEGQKRRDGLFYDFPPKKVGICSKRPSFIESGRTNATSFAVFLWKSGWKGEPTVEWLK